jgi:hypothetical protein
LTYTLTGWAKAKRGQAHIEINYFVDDKFLASEKAEAVTKDEWQERTLKANLDKYPEATHITASAQGAGDVEAWFDGFVLVAEGEAAEKKAEAEDKKPAIKDAPKDPFGPPPATPPRADIDPFEGPE